MFGFLMSLIVAALAMLVVAGAVQWLGDRRRSVEATGPTPAQLDRVESALSALESRLDDLQEQQRFLERLVAERPEPRSLPGREEEEAAEREAAAEREEEAEREEDRGILFDTKPSEEDR